MFVHVLMIMLNAYTTAYPDAYILHASLYSSSTLNITAVGTTPRARVAHLHSSVLDIISITHTETI